MYTLLAQIAYWSRRLSVAHAVRPQQDVAQQLMESADAFAGTCPHEAQELREAASAYLSVVR